LFLATIGLDIIYGTNRFVFNEPELMAGLNFIPVLIGLFAIPVVLDQYWTGATSAGESTALNKVGVTMAEFKRSFKSIIRGSFIGVGLGAIPGIGGAPAAFLSYSEARRTSKQGDNFGKGELEGVAAAEAGNNGVAGATMIPLLALGVPGDVITAVILGAFMIHGLRPGPFLFEQNIDMVYALFMGIMLSSIFLFIVGKVAIRFLSRISQIPNSVLLPCVLVLCTFGGYAVNNSMFDIMVMFLIGVLGFLMLRLKLPAAPFLIAFVLGPLLEDNFRQALLIGKGDPMIFFRSPICIIFWILTAVSLVFIAKRGIQDSKLVESLTSGKR